MFARIFSLLFFFLLLSVHSTIAQNNSIDSLKQLLLSDKEDTNKVIHLNELCIEYQNTGNYDTAFFYANNVLEFAEQINYSKGLVAALINVGNIYYYQNKYDLALKNMFSALEIGEAIGDVSGIAASNNIIGSIYFEQGKYENALKHYFISLKKREEIGDLNGVASSYNNIGTIYYEQGNLSMNNMDSVKTNHYYDKALEYFFSSVKILFKIDKKVNIASSYNNIGAVFQAQGNYVSALKYFLQALKVDKELGNKQGLAIDLNNIGNVYAMQGGHSKKGDENADRNPAYGQALSYFTNALNIDEELGNKQGMAADISNIGAIFQEQGKYQKAIECYNKSLRYSQEIGARNLSCTTYLALANLYVLVKDFENAYKYFQYSTQIKDSIFNIETRNNIAELQTKYETEKKQQEIERQHSIIEKRNYQVYSVSATLLLFTVITVLIILQLRTKAKKNASELQQKLLRIQMNPHFIFNALASIQGTVLEKSPDEAADYISKFASLMRLILENSKEEYIALSTEIKILNYYLELQQLRYDNVFDFSIKVTSIRKDIESGVPKVLPNEEDLGRAAFIPPMLAQPFIENAIEHGIVNKCSKGFIDVKFELEEKNIVFTVENYCSLPISPSKPEMVLWGEAHKPMAVAITKERLYYLNKGQKEKIELKFVQGEKAKVSFRIPLITN